MSEVAKNVHVTDSIVTDLLEDPRKWLDGLDGFEVRYVGGLFNLSHNDKKEWRNAADGPLRIIETGTGREEVWFPTEWKSPVYISLDKNGRLSSHVKYDIPQPALKQDIRQRSLDQLSEDLFVEFSLWYQEDHIHNTGDGAAVLSSKLRIAVPDDEYVAGVAFNLFREFWRDGEWQSTSIGEMNIIFQKKSMNGPENQRKALDWIAEHCRDGFFPFSNRLFANAEEEVMFLADVYTQG